MTRTIPLATAAAVAAAFLGVAAAQPAAAAQTYHVKIAIAGTDIVGDTTGATTAARIRKGLRQQGRTADERQIRRAAAVVVQRFGAKRRRRQPGIILIHFKTLKATVCVSWGRRKDYCNKHAKRGFVGLKKSFVN